MSMRWSKDVSSNTRRDEVNIFIVIVDDRWHGIPKVWKLPNLILHHHQQQRNLTPSFDPEEWPHHFLGTYQFGEKNNDIEVEGEILVVMTLQFM